MASSITSKNSKAIKNSDGHNVNVEDWAGRSDVCRCCLSTSGTWDLTGTYITDDGDREVFLDMIKHCYGITLSYLLEWGPSRFICNSCATSLRHAHSFKQQVLCAEKAFATYISGKDNFGLHEIKTDDEPMITDRSNTETLEENIESEPPACVRRTSPTRNYTKKRTRSSSNGEITEEIRCGDNRLEKFGCGDRQLEKIGSGDRRLENNSSGDRLKKSHDKNIRENRSSDKRLRNHCIIKENCSDDHRLEKIGSGDTILENRSSSEDGFKKRTNSTDVKAEFTDKKLVTVEDLTCEIVLRDTTACPFRHQKSWFQCFYCTQDFMEIKLLREHTTQNHKPDEVTKIKRYPRSLQIDITVFKCNACNIDLFDVKNMVKHFSDVHEKVVYKECIADYKVNKSPYTCHLCSKQYHVFRTLTTHLNEHYANCVCDVCGKSFLNSKRLKCHKRTHERGNFPCSECGKILKTKTSKANHMEAHAKRVIKCQICLKPMKHYNDRIKHMSEEHNITHNFKCLICGKEYNIKHYLATHMRQTHGHKNKKCLDCGMAFITNHYLKKHMLKHTGVKAFACTVCSKSYARSYTLREHMRVHEGDVKFDGQ